MKQRIIHLLSLLNLTEKLMQHTILDHDNAWTDIFC